MSRRQPAKQEQNIVKAWAFQNTLLEFYRYRPEKPEKLPAHCHDDYQFCFSVNYPSEYTYRKSVRFVPVGSLSIIHPGEMHSGTGRDIGNGKGPVTFRMMYVQPLVMTQVLEDAFDQGGSLPYFADLIVLDEAIAHLFTRFHDAFQGNAFRSQQDEWLQSFLVALLQKYADSRPAIVSFGQERQAVSRVRDYLHTHYADNVGLEQLAQVANLSPSYFSRVFKAEVGVSLSHYQSQLRIDRARALLVGGMSIKRVATQVGCADQSHLTHLFKRFVQTTPGNYGQENRKDRKNLQDFLT